MCDCPSIENLNPLVIFVCCFVPYDLRDFMCRWVLRKEKEKELAQTCTDFARTKIPLAPAPWPIEFKKSYLAERIH
jgi:hypothetical protein